MKIKNYVTLGLSVCIGTLSGVAQCNVLAGDDISITCGNTTSLFAQPRWNLLNNNSNAYAVFFTDVKTGYTVGGNGYIKKTIDGGATWATQSSTTANTLFSVSFMDITTGFAVGDNGTILKTTDAGNTWSTKISGTTHALRAVFCTNVTTAIAVGDGGTILKTTDAGNTWVSKVSPVTEGLFSVHFPSATIGYATCSGKIIKTIDGGETWLNLPNIIGTGYNSIFFTDVNTGYATGGAPGTGFIYKTTDGGNNWTPHDLNTNYGIAPVFFTDQNTGYAGSVGKIFKTTDGGLTWKWQGLGLMSVYAFHFPDPKTGYVVGYSNTFKYELPDAISWTPSTGLSATNIANPVAAPSVTTTYKVTTTTGTCTAVDSLTVFVDPLIVDAGMDLTRTCGDLAQIDSVRSNYTGAGSLTYSWFPTTGLNSATIPNPLVNVKKTTKYYVTVTTPNGCTAIDSLTVFVDPLTVEVGSDRTITCGDSLLFSQPFINYTGALAYSWLPATGLSSATIAQPVSGINQTTTYFLTITTTNGCVATDSLKIKINPLTANVAANPTHVCGATTQLNVHTNYKGTDVLSYSWLPATDINSATILNPIISATQTTKYTVTVTTPNGCSATAISMVHVDSLTADAGADQFHICGGSVQLPAVQSNYAGVGNLTYKWLPTTGLNNPSIPNPVSTEDGLTYTVTVSTSNGCKATDKIAVNLKPMDGIPICMVSVDTAKNLVIWNKPAGTAIDSILIYKETIASGVYVKVGSVSTDSANVFRDEFSHPDVSSNKYQISLLDSCGLETAKSAAHKTSHLSINKGVGTKWNLIWETYEGFLVTTYKIYRGTSPTNLTLLDAVSGSINQYTDNNPPIGDIYYQIEVVSPAVCTVSGLLNTSRSNVATNKSVGIMAAKRNAVSFSIYPNPATDYVTVAVNELFTGDLVMSLYNMLGGVVKEETLKQQKQQVDISELPNGFYTVELKFNNGSSKQKLIIQK